MSLYSDFRYQQAVNPDGYAANVAAWRKALFSAARAGLVPGKQGQNDQLAIWTGEELLRELETEHLRRPLALGAVIVGAERVLIQVTEPLRSPSKTPWLRGN